MQTVYAHVAVEYKRTIESFALPFFTATATWQPRNYKARLPSELEIMKHNTTPVHQSGPWKGAGAEIGNWFYVVFFLSKHDASHEIQKTLQGHRVAQLEHCTSLLIATGLARLLAVLANTGPALLKVPVHMPGLLPRPAGSSCTHARCECASMLVQWEHDLIPVAFAPII